jgi:hypothetical protein
MTINISKVKDLLLILNSFIGNEKKVFEKNFIQNYEINTNYSITIDGNYDSIKQFCLNAKLIVEKENYLSITKLGKDISKNINFDEKFNHDIIEQCLTNNHFSSILIPILEKFEINKQNKLWAERSTVFELFKNTNNMDLLNILYNVKFLIHEEMISVNSSYVDNFIITQTIKNQRPQSQSELDDLLLKQKLIGQYAEKIVLNYEKKRLTDLGYIEQAKRVKQISIENTKKGYDIESFNGIESDDIFPDRFIEVKGTTGKKLSFFWSENEIEKAKEFLNEYWIYSVTGIDLNIGIEKYNIVPEMIPNPYSRIRPYKENIPNDEFLKKQKKTFHITRND